MYPGFTLFSFPPAVGDTVFASEIFSTVDGLEVLWVTISTNNSMACKVRCKTMILVKKIIVMILVLYLMCIFIKHALA